MPLLEVRGLRKRFRVHGGGVQAVDGIDLALEPGETVGLVGESGSGKSTVARLLVRLLEPDAGTIRFDGHDVGALSGAALRAWRRRVQIVFQDPYASLNPRLRVGEALAEPLLVHGLATRHAAAERVAGLLETVGLDASMARRYPHQLSGGQRQRVAIARAIAVEPQVIVLDEPLSALDLSVQAQILQLLRRLQERLGLAYLLISHDLRAVEQISHRVLVMYLGRIVEAGPTERLFDAPQHPYTRALLSAVPRPPGGAVTRIVLRGDVPSPRHVPPGCAFHPRCPEAWQTCATREPALAVPAPGQEAACHLYDAGALAERRTAGVSDAPP